MSSGTGLLRVAFQGFSRPSLVKSLAAVFPDQLTAPGSPRMGKLTLYCVKLTSTVFLSSLGRNRRQV